MSRKKQKPLLLDSTPLGKRESLYVEQSRKRVYRDANAAVRSMYTMYQQCGGGRRVIKKKTGGD